MLVYQTRPDGVFVGVVAADEDPKNKGQYLIPRGCVEVEPPNFEAPNRARWHEGEWIIEITPEEEPKENLSEPPTQDLFRKSIQKLIDDIAQTRGYDSGVSLASYTNSTVVSWAAEATSFIEWRDRVWKYAYIELSKIEAGEKDIPKLEDFLNALPQIEWPV